MDHHHLRWPEKCHWLWKKEIRPEAIVPVEGLLAVGVTATELFYFDDSVVPGQNFAREAGEKFASLLWGWSSDVRYLLKAMIVEGGVPHDHGGAM